MDLLSNVRAANQDAPVTLVVNEESYRVPANNARGKSVSQLFAEYSSVMGVDATRIKTYVLNNESVPGETVIRPGETVRGAITSEEKG
jgi:hypothetical protein